MESGKGGLFHLIPNYREDPTDAIAYHRLAVHLTSLQSRACSASKCWLKLLPKMQCQNIDRFLTVRAARSKIVGKKKRWSMDFPFFAHYYYLPKLFFAAVAPVKICLWKCPKLIFKLPSCLFRSRKSPLLVNPLKCFIESEQLE